MWVILNFSITLNQRAHFYNSEFPKYPPLVTTDRWLYGMWMFGNYYKGSGYHGAYPPSYVKRIMSLFPDADDVLHLFSGSLTNEVRGDRFDISDEFSPDIVGDAHELSLLVKKKYDLILADPPYSEEDAMKYGNSMISRNKVVEQCVKVLKPGGFLVWMDMIYPMYKKKEILLIGTIGLVRSTNHRTRCVFIWQKRML